MATTPLEWAHEFATRGLRVHPNHWLREIVDPDTGRLTLECSCIAGAECKSPGKHPLLGNWPELSTTDHGVIDGWWSENPYANLGVNCDGITVPDIDPRNGGNASYEAIVKDDPGAFPPTFEVATGGGGRHFYYRGAIDKAAAKFGPGIDCKTGSHAQVVGPGSEHFSGGSYVVVEDREFAPLPPVLRARASKPDRTASDSRKSSALVEHAGTGERNDALKAAAAFYCNHSDTLEELLAHVQVFNAKHCNPMGDPERVLEIVTSRWKTHDGKHIDPVAVGGAVLDLETWQANGNKIDVPPELNAAVATELVTQRVRATARKLLADEEAAALFIAPPSTLDLRAELAIDDGPLTYSIDRCHPSGTNSTLTAQYKTGKTTNALNLVHAVADDEMFLSRYATALPPGRRVAWLNFELSERQARHWLRRMGIQHLERVAVLHLRGFSLPLWESTCRAWLREWLLARDVGFLIVDPVARALAGLSENSNDDLTRFTEAFDVLLREAEVPDSLTIVHTGRAEQVEGQEHGRGATRLDDWADARWIYTRDGNSKRRFFRAEGRDVDVAEHSVDFDPETLRLSTTLASGESRAGQRVEEMVKIVCGKVTAAPGINAGALRTAAGGDRKGTFDQALAIAIERRHVRQDKGAGTALVHYPGDVPCP